MQPHFIIIGAQKSGTTFLQNSLRDHPDVYMPQGESPIFENPDYDESKIQPYFAKHFRTTKSKFVLGIKRPVLLGCDVCAKRIYKHAPNVHLVAILRNPVERAVSAYFHYMRDGFIPLAEINKGMTKIINGEYNLKYPRAKEIVELGFYKKNLKSYLKYFPHNKILILLYQDLKNDPQKLIDSVCDFLEIDRFYPNHINSQPQSGIYSYKRLRYRRLMNRFLYNYSQDLTRLHNKKLKTVQKYLIHAYLSVDNRIFAKICPRRKPLLNSQTKRKLINIYKNDVLQLEKIIGHDLKDWLI